MGTNSDYLGLIYVNQFNLGANQGRERGPHYTMGQHKILLGFQSFLTETSAICLKIPPLDQILLSKINSGEILSQIYVNCMFLAQILKIL